MITSATGCDGFFLSRCRKSPVITAAGTAPIKPYRSSLAWSGMISRERGGSIGFTEAPLLHYVNARWPRGRVSFRNIHYHIGAGKLGATNILSILPFRPFLEPHPLFVDQPPAWVIPSNRATRLAVCQARCSLGRL